MSSVSRWSYTNIATVWPRGKKDQLNGGSTWGEPYLIACTWIATSVRMADSGSSTSGQEFTSQCDYFHEDARVGYMDKIKKGDHTSVADPTAPGFANDIRSHLQWDMSMFKSAGKPDIPDYKSTV